MNIKKVGVVPNTLSKARSFLNFPLGKKEKTNIREELMKRGLMDCFLMIISLFYTSILKIGLAIALKFSLPNKILAKSKKLLAITSILLMIAANPALAGSVVAKYGELNVTKDLIVADDALFVGSVNKIVGIGTIYPMAPLEIKRDIAQLFITNPSIGGITWRLMSTANSWAAGGGKLAIGASPDSSAEVMYLTSDGKVGIGTANPANKLEVNGKIYSSDDVCIDGKCLSSTGLNSLFLGKTSSLYQGSLGGYSVANSICNTKFPGSHMCTVNEILDTMIYEDVSNIVEWSGTAWIMGGPPGYLADANDCLGFTSNKYNDYGRFWNFDDTTNEGIGWLTPCSQQKQIACCKEGW